MTAGEVSAQLPELLTSWSSKPAFLIVSFITLTQTLAWYPSGFAGGTGVF